MTFAVLGPSLSHNLYCPRTSTVPKSLLFQDLYFPRPYTDLEHLLSHSLFLALKNQEPGMAKLHGHQLKQERLNAKDEAYTTPTRLSQGYHSQRPIAYFQACALFIPPPRLCNRELLHFLVLRHPSSCDLAFLESIPTSCTQALLIK